MRRTLPAVAVAVVATALALHAGRTRPGRPAAPSPAPAAERVARLHYALRYQQDVEVAGQAPVVVAVRGAWIVTPHRSGRTEVHLVPAAIEGPRGAIASAADAALPVQLVHAGGVLAAMGFAPAMPARGRALLTTLATALQLSATVGEVVEDDVLGRYQARYERTGATVHRDRDLYTALRGAGGLSAAAARDVTPAEDSRFTVDAHGVVTAEIDVAIQVDPGDDLPAVAMHVRAHLERTAIEWVPASAAPLYPAGPVTDHVDHRGLQQRLDRNRVAGATVASLLEDLARAALLDAPDAGPRRAALLSRLAAAIRLDPSAAATVADALRAHPEFPLYVELLAGALASSGVAEGTDALAALVRDELPAVATSRVLDALTLSEPVTAASLAALTASLDGADRVQAALALGSHDRRAGAALADAAGAATRELLDRYAAASGDDRALYARALGNSGAPAAVPALRTALASADPGLAGAAVFALRFVPGPEVDALLEDALARPDLAFTAVRAIGFRDPAAWRARLEAARVRYADRNDVLAAIHRALRRGG